MRDAEPDPLRTSPYAEQLASGFRWLRFELELEAEFWREQFEQGVGQLRVGFVLGLLLAATFAGLHHWLLPPPDLLTGLLRFGVVFPLLATGLALTFVPGAARWLRLLAALIAPVLVVAVTVLVLRNQQLAAGDLFPVLVITNVFAFYLLGQSFYGALRTGVLGFAVFVAGALGLGLPGEQAFYQAVLLLVTILVGATVSYTLESARRTGWLEARLLAEMAERDGLTGIYNRRRLDAHLRRAWQQALREQRPLGLLMIDIDCFKAYNDRYGHQAGDEVLKAVAGSLARAARRPLDVVARYGGEEFAIVLYDTTREYASELAQRVTDSVRALAIPHAASACAPVVTVSVGVAVVQPIAERSPEGFVQLADQALYAAKSAGRDRVSVMQEEYAHLRTGSFELDRRQRA